MKNTLEYLGARLTRTMRVHTLTTKRLNITNYAINCLQCIIGRQSNIDAHVKYRIIRTCILSSLSYEISCLLPLYNETNLKKLEVTYKKALKNAASLPMQFPTEDLWLKEKPFRERLRDLHLANIEKLTTSVCPYLNSLTNDDRREFHRNHAKRNILRPVPLTG